jgi:hypothetical protein
MFVFIFNPQLHPLPPNPGLFAKNKQRQGDDVTSLMIEQKGGTV